MLIHYLVQSRDEHSFIWFEFLHLFPGCFLQLKAIIMFLYVCLNDRQLR